MAPTRFMRWGFAFSIALQIAETARAKSLRAFYDRQRSHLTLWVDGDDGVVQRARDECDWFQLTSISAIEVKKENGHAEEKAEEQTPGP